jgi:adenosylcobalamin-dependent ribonucleoside-triphosphate reductase
MMIDRSGHETFSLSDDFLEQYRNRPVNWGFGALSWVTYRRTYSRNGEHWWQTCRRVIEGVATVRRIHAAEHGIAWDAVRARHTAEEAYARMFVFKWMPPGRGLWIMGTDFMYERGGAALNNCGFVSTRRLDADFASPFVWSFGMAMLGVGVGFDTRGEGKVRIQKPETAPESYEIEDSREGWSRALGRLLDAYAGKSALPARWDFGRIRPRGSKLESFGGYASGPEPLRAMLSDVQALLETHCGKYADSTLIVDLMNLTGRCVVSGGIRLSAQIALGRATDRKFIELKQDREKTRDYRWVSNNSVTARIGMDYAPLAALTAENGEPGYFWIENARAFGRMKDPPDNADAPADGCNPCGEQTLWDRELCCLVETYPAHHDTLEDYLQTLRIAYEYAKTVTLVPAHDKASNAVMSRNRRIGCSMTGVVQAVNRLGYRAFFQWCEHAYKALLRWDVEFSGRLRVPCSVKRTSVKPSGTISLLAGASPGVHWEFASYYLRRMRLQEGHPLAEACRTAGYPVEPDVYSKQTVVVSFPVHAKNIRLSRKRVPLWQKVDLAARMQHYWADNQVSCTATFDPETEKSWIAQILEAYEDRLKAITFLPEKGHGYEQPPYEEISGQYYKEILGRLKPIEVEVPHEEQYEARFCDSGQCDWGEGDDGA